MSRCPFLRGCHFLVSRLIDFIYFKSFPFVAPLLPPKHRMKLPSILFFLFHGSSSSSSRFVISPNSLVTSHCHNRPRENIEGGVVEGMVAGLITSLVDKTLVDTVLRARLVEESSWMGEERARNPQVDACHSGGRSGVGGEEGWRLYWFRAAGYTFPWEHSTRLRTCVTNHVTWCNVYL